MAEPRPRGRRRIEMLPRLFLLLLLLPVATGCGDPDAPPDDSVEIGTLVARWSQADHERLYERWGRRPDGLVDTDAEREEILAVLPGGDEAVAVRAVDLTEELLVVGSYAKCLERSRVLVEGAEVWLDVYVAEEDQNTNCGWSPLQVEVWSVPRAELDGAPSYRSD